MSLNSRPAADEAARALLGGLALALVAAGQFILVLNTTLAGLGWSASAAGLLLFLLGRLRPAPRWLVRALPALLAPARAHRAAPVPREPPEHRGRAEHARGRAEPHERLASRRARGVARAPLLAILRVRHAHYIAPGPEKRQIPVGCYVGLP